MQTLEKCCVLLLTTFRFTDRQYKCVALEIVISKREKMRCSLPVKDKHTSLGREGETAEEAVKCKDTSRSWTRKNEVKN